MMNYEFSSSEVRSSGGEEFKVQSSKFKSLGGEEESM
jgi:hypothetical protein